MTVLATERPARFRAEADMLMPLARAKAVFSKGCTALFEVPCTAGVPDIVLVQFDKKALGDRGGRHPLTELVDVRVLAATAHARHPITTSWTTDSLASAAGVTAIHLKRSVLPRLVDGGHLETDGKDWRPTYRFRSLARKVVTIEAKLRDWRGAIAQASRHTSVADAAWVAMDASSVRTAANNHQWFTTYGVGLAAVAIDGTVSPMIRPAAPHTRPVHRELLVERAAALHQAGRVSGELPRVFGQTLVATTGADPRLIGVGAH
ncbi:MULTISPECIES: hypothetical protein [Rhodococcus]|uniref:Uncharacterized protein n=1 Tax=Rhodococcus koreensis TaxID=99653 RepID=A0A1H5F5H3_9NOCA|nr:hypothetical protein [Rhodococcus koreensis]SED98540.1 hypothetical protein SAMN04490239_9497 [Rhodococcus koreensis]